MSSLKTNTGTAFLDKNQRIWGSEASESQGQALFRAVLRLEVGLFDSAYDASIKSAALDHLPYGLPPPGESRSHGIGSKEHEWKCLLGLESEGGNIDEDGSRA